MSYGKFETIEQVSDTFEIDVTRVLNTLNWLFGVVSTKV